MLCQQQYQERIKSMGSSLWQNQTEGHQVNRTSGNKGIIGLSHRQVTPGRKSSSSRLLSYYLYSSLHRRKGPKRHDGFVSFFIKDNLQLIHLKMQCSRKKLPLTVSYLTLHAVHTIKSHQIIDPLTSHLSAETQTWHFSFGKISYSGTHKLGF